MALRASAPWVILTSLALGPAGSGAGTLDPKLVLHVVPETRYPCWSTAPSEPPNCDELTIQGDLGVTYQVYIMATGVGPGINIAEFGIGYDPNYDEGVDVLKSCSFAPGYWGYPGPFGSWPASQSGVKFFWSSCQPSVGPVDSNLAPDVLIAALTVVAFDDDILYLLPHPNGNTARFRICNNPYTYVLTNLEERALGRAGFGERPGFNPCTGEGVWTEPPEYPPPPPPPALSPPAVLLHIGPATESEGGCDQGPAAPEDVVTWAALDPETTPRYLYLLGVPQGANDPEPIYGVTGFQLGVDYEASRGPGQGLEVLEWSTCSDLEFPQDDWPAPGSGNTVTWSLDNCQQRDLVVGGYFSVIARGPETMSIVPYPQTGFVKMATCNGAEVLPERDIPPARLGWISLGGAAKGTDQDGCNPLLTPCVDTVTPVLSTTWGRLKQLYR